MKHISKRRIFKFRATSFSEDGLEPLLMRWQLAICQGNLTAASRCAHQVRKWPESTSAVYKVRGLILEADLACLNKDFACNIYFFFRYIAFIFLPFFLFLSAFLKIESAMKFVL
jgi:hypothetical protein